MACSRSEEKIERKFIKSLQNDTVQMSDDFDNKLRDKWEQKQFPVDDNHRQQMIALLDAQQRRKRGIIWWFGGAGIAIIGIGLIGLFNANKSNTTTSPTIQIDSINTVNNPPLVTDNNVKENDLTSTSSDQPNLSHQSLSDKKINISNKRNPQSKSGISSNSNSQHNYISKNVPFIAKNTIVSLKKSDFNNDENTKVILNSNQPITETSEPTITEINQDLSKPMDGVEFNLFRNSYITSPLESNFYSEIEYSGPVVPKNIIPAFSNFHSLRLYTELGSGYIPSVKQVYSSGWNLMAGAGLKYKLGAKTSLFLSAGYLMQSNGFKFERTSVIQQPGFGTRSNFNTLIPDKLHFIYSKVGVQYELQRNVFSASIGGQWLYGAQGNIVITYEDQLTGNNIQTSDYAWLKTDGMRHLLMNTELLYGYRITPRICLQGGVKYYFSSIDKEDTVLHQEGYYWKGNFSSIVPSIIINYHLYGRR
jgi:hypothetical protein